MVIGYNPSHSNINSEVNAPFKILSVLLRFLDVNDHAPKQSHGMAEFKMRRDDANDERLDTMGEDAEDDADYGDEGEFEMKDAIEVDLGDVEDDEEEVKQFDFNKGTAHDRGLADLETGSEVYLSEMLDFEYEEYDENEEQNEDDLNRLQDSFATNIDIKKHVGE